MFRQYKKILKVGQLWFFVQVDTVSHVILVQTTGIGVVIIGRGMLVRVPPDKDGRRVTLLTFIIDLLSSNVENLYCTQKSMFENAGGFLWKASKLVATSSVLQCHYL